MLDALGIGTIDLYGDSYGSYFAQAFAVRHPGRLRSLVLDATYPLPGTDPAFGDLAEATRRALRLVCDAPAELRRARPGSRRRDRAAGGAGARAPGRRHRAELGRRPHPVTVDEESLVTSCSPATRTSPIYRDVIAAVRAWNAGDRDPLFRLVAENTLDPHLVRCAASRRPSTSR